MEASTKARDYVLRCAGDGVTDEVMAMFDEPLAGPYWSRTLSGGVYRGLEELVREHVDLVASENGFEYDSPFDGGESMREELEDRLMAETPLADAVYEATGLGSGELDGLVARAASECRSNVHDGRDPKKDDVFSRYWLSEVLWDEHARDVIGEKDARRLEGVLAFEPDVPVSEMGAYAHPELQALLEKGAAVHVFDELQRLGSDPAYYGDEGRQLAADVEGLREMGFDLTGSGGFGEKLRLAAEAADEPDGPEVGDEPLFD